MRLRDKDGVVHRGVQNSKTLCNRWIPGMETVMVNYDVSVTCIGCVSAEQEPALTHRLLRRDGSAARTTRGYYIAECSTRLDIFYRIIEESEVNEENPTCHICATPPAGKYWTVRVK